MALSIKKNIFWHIKEENFWHPLCLLCWFCYWRGLTQGSIPRCSPSTCNLSILTLHSHLNLLYVSNRPYTPSCNATAAWLQTQKALCFQGYMTCIESALGSDVWSTHPARHRQLSGQHPISSKRGHFWMFSLQLPARRKLAHQREMVQLSLIPAEPKHYPLSPG